MSRDILIKTALLSLREIYPKVMRTASVTVKI